MANKKPIDYTLYTVTCNVNDKVYIGVCRWYVQRVAKHKYDLIRNGHGNRYLQEDVNKYGLSSLHFDVVAKYDSRNEALRIEKYYTDCIFQKNKDVCYNIMSGGADVAAQMREIFKSNLESNPSKYEYLREVRAKISKGRVTSDETKEKQRLSRLGTKASAETKSIFSKQRKGAGNSKAKNVIDANTGKIYGCLKDAAIDLGLNYDMVRARINGYNKQKTSLQWL